MIFATGIAFTANKITNDTQTFVRLYSLSAWDSEVIQVILHYMDENYGTTVGAFQCLCKVLI